MIHFSIPGRAKSASNLREHWAAKMKRVKAERDRAYRHALAAGVKQLGPLLVVTLTRRSPRLLDESNLGAALKAHQDGIASSLRVDDASQLVRFVLRQQQGPEDDVLVEINTGQFPSDWPEQARSMDAAAKFLRDEHRRSAGDGPLEDDTEPDVVEQMEGAKP